jgi:alpha-L-rhamnosidase
LKECYDNIKRYVDHINEISPSGLTTWGLGDWVPVKSKSPVELTSTAYYYTDALILAKAAKLFNKTADQKKYEALAKKIKEAFNEKYFKKDSMIYASGSQTELSVPLFWGLVPVEYTSQVALNLARRVERDSFHLDVGLLGQKAILNALSENGHADVAYRIATQKTFPSWGWWIVNGATTLYENWNIDSKYDISLNHIMFGEIGAWLYKGLGGIRPDPSQPGFKNVLIRPFIPDDMDSFEASHDGPFGKIVSSWKRENKQLIYTIVVPANSTAELELPDWKINKPMKDGKKITRWPVQLKPGVHRFIYK